jgi:hypothetical protein
MPHAAVHATAERYRSPMYERTDVWSVESELVPVECWAANKTNKRTALPQGQAVERTRVEWRVVCVPVSYLQVEVPPTGG